MSHPQVLGNTAGTNISYSELLGNTAGTNISYSQVLGDNAWTNMSCSQVLGDNAGTNVSHSQVLRDTVGTNMSHSQVLRALVTQRLTAAAEDICALFERTIAEYEQEVLLLTHSNISQQQRPSPQQHQSTTGVQIMFVNHDLPDVKGESESQVQGLPFAPVTVKTEYDENLSSVPHQRPNEEKRETNREDCGVEAGCSSHPLTQFPSDSEEQSDSSDHTDHSEDWVPKQTKERSFNAINQLHFPVMDLRPYSCSDCGRAFKNKADLRRHMSVHTGERPHKCSVCEKCFKDKGNLNKHVRVHTGEKPYSCSICAERFCWKSLLNVHMTRHFGKPLECPVCQRRFTVKQGLEAHMRTHTNEKPFRCSVCKSDFKLKEQLKIHMMRNHTEATPSEGGTEATP